MLNDLFQSRVPLAVAALGLGLTAAVGAVGAVDNSGAAHSAPQARCGGKFLAVQPAHTSALFSAADCF